MGTGSISWRFHSLEAFDTTASSTKGRSPAGLPNMWRPAHICRPISKMVLLQVQEIRISRTLQHSTSQPLFVLFEHVYLLVLRHVWLFITVYFRLLSSELFLFLPNYNIIRSSFHIFLRYLKKYRNDHLTQQFNYRWTLFSLWCLLAYVLPENSTMPNSSRSLRFLY